MGKHRYKKEHDWRIFFSILFLVALSIILTAASHL